MKKEEGEKQGALTTIDENDKGQKKGTLVTVGENEPRKEKRSNNHY